MLKHKLISERVFSKFGKIVSQAPAAQSEELSKYLSRLKKSHKTLDPEFLRFDSNLESGNLDRVEA